MSRGGPAASALLVCLLAGCGGSGHAAGAREAAEAFQAALARQDGAAACGLLAPETAREVGQSERASCAQGVLEEDLPRGGTTKDTQVWGRAAQVRLGADTVFLSRFADGWKVLAAGCSPRPGKPYDCTVQGG